MKIKFTKFLNENIFNGVEVKNIGSKSTNDLREHFIHYGMEDDDVDSFCRNSDKVNIFELKVSRSLNLTLSEIFDHYNFIIQSLTNIRQEDNFINYNEPVVFDFYWPNMGNGLTSIIEEGELHPKYNADIYTIYSGEKKLDKFLDEELELMISSKIYNL